MEWLLQKPRSLSNLPAFSDPNGSLNSLQLYKAKRVQKDSKLWSLRKKTFFEQYFDNTRLEMINYLILSPLQIGPLTEVFANGIPMRNSRLLTIRPRQFGAYFFGQFCSSIQITYQLLWILICRKKLICWWLRQLNWFLRLKAIRFLT